jgi:hypothetical protein
MNAEAGSEARKVRWKNQFEWRFLPINKLLHTTWMQQVFPKLLWLVVPLQYYYARQMPAGFNIDSYLPSTALVIVLMVSMVCGGGLIAILYPRSEYYYDAARALVSSMLGTWAFALALVCLSFWFTGYLLSRPQDVVQDFLCPLEPASWMDAVCSSKSMRHMLVYSIYALTGAALLTMFIHGCARFKARRNDDFRPLREPNIVVVAIAVAVLMTVFQWLITTG